MSSILSCSSFTKACCISSAQQDVQDVQDTMGRRIRCQHKSAGVCRTDHECEGADGRAVRAARGGASMLQLLQEGAACQNTCVPTENTRQHGVVQKHDRGTALPQRKSALRKCYLPNQLSGQDCVVQKHATAQLRHKAVLRCPSCFVVAHPTPPPESCHPGVLSAISASLDQSLAYVQTRLAARLHPRRIHEPAQQLPDLGTR